MALPSLADALIVIILLIPGFFAFTIIRWLGSYGSKLSEFQVTIASFSFSMVILFFYTMSTGLTDIDNIRDKFFIPQNYLALFGITLAIGFGVGMIARRRRQNYTRFDSWQKTFTQKLDEVKWLIVITKNGKEYKGILKRVGIEEVKDLTLFEPKEILRNNSGEVLTEIHLGEELLFREDDISRVIFLEQT